MTLIQRLQDPYYHGAAAEMGFYFIFSIVPIITILTQILTPTQTMRLKIQTLTCLRQMPHSMKKTRYPIWQVLLIQYKP